MFAPCSVIQYLVSILVLQSFCCLREIWLLYFNCLLIFLLLVFCGPSSWCHGLVYSVLL